MGRSAVTNESGRPASRIAPVPQVLASTPAPAPATTPKAKSDPVAALTSVRAVVSADTLLALDFVKLNFIPAKDPVSSLTGQPYYIAQTSPAILAYTGRKIRISGYMLPVSMEGNEIREFMIMANQLSCCFGTPPLFCEFIVVRMKNEASPFAMDRLQTFVGTLRVGDVFANGYWTQFYTLECDGVGR